MKTKKNSSKLGFLSGLFAGIGYLLYAILFIIDPLDRITTDSSGFYTGFIAGKGTIWILGRLIFIIANTIAVAFVISIYRYFVSLEHESVNQDVVEYVTVLGVAGFILQAYSFADQLTHVITVSRSYGDLTQDQQAVFNSLEGDLIDRYGIVRGGLLAIWLITIAYYGMKSINTPNVLNILTLIGGITFFLLPIDSLLLNSTFNFTINASAGILGPVVFIWYGFLLQTST